MFYLHATLVFLVLMVISSRRRAVVVCSILSGLVIVTGGFLMTLCLRTSKDAVFHAIALSGIGVVMSGLFLFLFLWYKNQIRRLTGKDIAARVVDDSRFWSDKPPLAPAAGAVCVICLTGSSGEPWGRAACCGTQFHKECVRMHFRHQNRVSCPICRQHV